MWVGVGDVCGHFVGVVAFVGVGASVGICGGGRVCGQLWGWTRSWVFVSVGAFVEREERGHHARPGRLQLRSKLTGDAPAAERITFAWPTMSSMEPWLSDEPTRIPGLQLLAPLSLACRRDVSCNSSSFPLLRPASAHRSPGWLGMTSGRCNKGGWV